MATLMKAYDHPRWQFKTPVNCQIKNHLKSHDWPNTHNVFNCANAIEPLKCFRCTNFETHNLAYLKHHFKADHALSKFEAEHHNCENCSFQTYSNYLSLRHKLSNLCQKIRTIKPEPLKPTKRSRVKLFLKWYVCDSCPYRTQFHSDIQRHVLVMHTDPNKIAWFDCEHCSFKSKTKSNLKRHSDRIHGNMEYWKCDRCPFKTKGKSALKYHKFSKHLEADKIQWFECAQCSFKGKTQYSLKRHLDNKHGSNRCMKCDSCPFETNYKKVLREHILCKHTDRDKIQWFQCEQCSYRSITKTNLKVHEDYKHGNKEFMKCDQCTFETRYKRTMEKHLLSKHGDPEKIQWFECAQCAYKTYFKHNLSSHIVRKHKQQWFQCAHCPYKSDSQTVLRNHIIAKHAEDAKIQWFQCDHCPYKSTVKRYWKRHVLRMHTTT